MNSFALESIPIMTADAASAAAFAGFDNVDELACRLSDESAALALKFQKLPLAAAALAALVLAVVLCELAPTVVGSVGCV